MSICIALRGAFVVKPTGPQPANTMLVFMIQGLFTSLQFAYAQFPSAELSDQMLYGTFWDAVMRVENCGLKVCVHTFCMPTLTGYIPPIFSELNSIETIIPNIANHAK